MVHKVKFTILFIIYALVLFLCFIPQNNVEFNLLKTLLPKSISNSDDIILATNKSSSIIKVVFEANDENELENLTDNFLKRVDGNYFEFDKPDIQELLSSYLSSPSNFLSDNTKNYLKNKEYDKVYANAINMLYNPASLQLTSFENDPYLLFDDFILNNKKISNEKNYIDGIYYDSIMLKIKNNEGLSPNLCNKKIKELIKIQHDLSDKNSKIYLAGAPIHSYYASIKSVISINIICILSTALIIFLTHFYFNGLSPIIPIIISISFGMLFGFCITRFWFYDFQIITLVFSMTLIGIGIDYSYHYFFSDKNAKFNKNLTFSFLTSIVPFVLLYLTGIEILKQIAVFCVFGLFGIYFAVLFIYPDFNIKIPYKTIELNKSFYKTALIMLIVLSISGLFRFHFNDNLTALYSPTKKLKKAEILYNKISGDNIENTKIIPVKGNNIEEIIKSEEKITPILAKNDIQYMSLSKIIPSKEIQKENFELVKGLYKDNLDNFKNILSAKQIQALKASKFTSVKFDIEKYSFLKDFMPNNKTSLILVFSDKKIDLKELNVIDFKADIEKCIKKYRKLILLMFPVAIIVLMILLTLIYGYKKATKMLTPPILGSISAILTSCLIMGEINLFSIIAMFLVIGFTMDYSIFRMNKEEKTENAILISCATTSFSFLLLSFCGFKLLSSISLVLFFGIITSYISGNLLFQNKKQ